MYNLGVGRQIEVCALHVPVVIIKIKFNSYYFSNKLPII